MKNFVLEKRLLSAFNLKYEMCENSWVWIQTRKMWNRFILNSFSVTMKTRPDVTAQLNVPPVSHNAPCRGSPDGRRDAGGMWTVGGRHPGLGLVWNVIKQSALMNEWSRSGVCFSTFRLLILWAFHRVDLNTVYPPGWCTAHINKTMANETMIFIMIDVLLQDRNYILPLHLHGAFYQIHSKCCPPTRRTI